MQQGAETKSLILHESPRKTASLSKMGKQAHCWQEGPYRAKNGK